MIGHELLFHSLNTNFNTTMLFYNIWAFIMCDMVLKFLQFNFNSHLIISEMKPFLLKILWSQIVSKINNLDWCLPQRANLEEIDEKTGFKALHFAAFNGSDRNVDLLLTRRANVNDSKQFQYFSMRVFLNQV